MKKLMAGILAIVSVLSVSTVAQAAQKTKTVKRQGEVEYDVEATRLKVAMNLIVPSKMKAALNPYGVDFDVDDAGDVSSNSGIVSAAYPLENLSTDCGLFVDAVAITTTTNKNLNVTTGALTPGVKGANMAVKAATTEAGLAGYSNVKKAATSATDQGNLPLDSTVPADKTKGIVKGQTSLQKLAYVPASADGETPSKVFIGFVGKLAGDSADTVINWTDNDSININLVLKITPAPKTL